MVDLTRKLQPQTALTDSFAADLTQENLKLLLTTDVDFTLQIVQRPWLSLKSMDALNAQCEKIIIKFWLGNCSGTRAIFSH